MSKLIVIEGLDGSGKGTQSKLLHERLTKEGFNLHRLSFPQYKKDSSYFIRQYLGGAYGTTPASVSAEQATLCYAMDRFDLFKSDQPTIEAVADPGKILLADRYTTSNILYQASKAKTLDELYRMIDWICELEYHTLGIPEPDMVIMPFVAKEQNFAMMQNRNIAANAHNNNMARDIHEESTKYLSEVHDLSTIIAERMGFDVINCTPDGVMRTKEDIHEEIYDRAYQKVLKYMPQNK